MLHRFPNANHLVMAEADVATVADHFISEVISAPNSDPRLRRDFRGPGLGNPDANEDFRGLGAGVRARAGDDTTAFVDMATGDEVSFAELARRIDAIAADLVRRGLEPGDRVAMVTPPGIDLVAAVYGVWRAGGVTVVADRGLGLRGARRGDQGCASDLGDRASTGTARGADAPVGAALDRGRHRGVRAAPRHPPEVHRCRPNRQRTMWRRSCSPPAPPGRRRGWCTATGSSRRSATRSPVPTASPPTTVSSPRSRRSRCTARRSASRRAYRRATSPSRPS